MLKTPFGIRLWLLIAALFLVAGGVVYGLFSSWHHVQVVEAKLTTSQIERFQLASEVRRELQSLNNSVLRYALLRDPRQWTQFQQASTNLDQWIDSYDPSLNPRSPINTDAERRVFQELNHVYDDYMAAARAVYSNAQPAMVTASQLAQLDGFDAEADRIRELVRQLTDAHRAAEAAFLANASSSLSSLRGMLVAGVAMLLALVAAMGYVIYRDTIEPLRTRLVRSELLLERQEKLATLGTLAAGIAHEIRNPLTSLKARLYTLEKHLQVVPAARKDTDIIGAEISRLERIVRDVLSFARPSEPRLETIEAATVLNEVQGLMSPDLEKRDVRLLVESDPDLHVLADSGHVKQALINLVRNAAEAIDSDGTVTLRARAGRAALGGRETDAVIFEVSDDGSGIPPEVEKRLFDPFFTTKETGTGLGLPIAARMVEKQGGILQYKTRLGHGTTFGVVLPRAMNDIAVIANASSNLLIEDDASLAANLCDVLKEDGFLVSVCNRGDEGLCRASADESDVVLTDLRLPGLGGLELVRRLHDTMPRLPVVLMTAHGTVETAIEATKLGAYDYLQKPFEMPALISLLQRAVDASRLMREPVSLAEAPSSGRTALVGASRAMQEVCKEIGRVAAKPVTVLIRGETGTGKELIARAIYQHSVRAKAPFIAINCAAIPENLLESELFGHERGAFTGADQRRIGRFEQANHGTLFLDEIGDLPANTQVKLLRVLQQQTFQRVGGSEAISVDVRVIAATHRNLETMLREGTFREDLFHRLNVVCLQLPALRERREDVPVLVQHFLKRYAGDFGIDPPSITADAVAVLQADSWPGNVRELENMTRRLLLAARGLSIGAEAVRQTLATRQAESVPTGRSFGVFAGDLLAQAQKGALHDAHARMVEEAEREILTQAITLAEGNQAKAARWLGLSRFTLREKLKQFGLHPGSNE